MAWDDSVLCELVHPSLTALRRDIAAAGAEGARRMIGLVGGSEVGDFQEPPPVLVGAAAPPPRPGRVNSRRTRLRIVSRSGI